MSPFPTNRLDEIYERLKQIENELEHVQQEYEVALLEDKPVELLKQLKNRLLVLKRKHVLFEQVVQHRNCQ
jgi:hypothetical protein